MFRFEIIQKVLNTIGGKHYIEIGLGGDPICFRTVNAENKIGIDPQVPYNIYSMTNEKVKYYQMTSDAFFAEKHILLNNKVDVVFIDGLHEYKQVVRDVENSLECLNDGGVIVMHDCNPSTKEMATPFTPGLNINTLPLGLWTGDAWKAVVHLRSTRNDINIFVLDTDFGVGVVTKGVNKNKLNFSINEIEQMVYEDFDKNKEMLVNLKNKEYIDEFCSGLKKVY